MIGREEELRQYRERVAFFYGVVIFALGLILSRLFYLQILHGEELRSYSEANRLKKERLFPTRGILYDRNGEVIVDNRASFDVVLFAQYYPFKDAINRRLARALEMPVEELEKKLKKARRGAAFHSFLLRSDVSPDIIAAIEMDAEGFPGVDIEATPQRRYPYDDLAAQMLGYVGEVNRRDLKRNDKLQSGDYIGKMGIERYYDEYLRGANGVGYVEVDARGHRRRRTEEGEKLLGYVTQTDPTPGHNLYLSLDVDVELAARRALRDREFKGTVIALDPRSGEILAMINEPSFHPESLSGREVDSKTWRALSTSTDRPLRNRAVQDHYPPGSTFKPFMSIAGLSEGLRTEKDHTTCRGHMRFGRRRFHCWKRHGSHVDFYRALKESCDIYYYELGDELGVNRIAKYSRMFGFGSRTGIKLYGEQPGLIPDEEWKARTYKEPWQAGETLSVAIGQGFVTVTPLQLASAFGALANGGFLYRPYLVRRIERRDGQIIREFQPELMRRIEVPPEFFEQTKEGLFQVVNGPAGTARRSMSNLTVLSGKTGTVQVRSFANIRGIRCNELEEKFRHHGIFAGYAPRENPEIVVVAVGEHACGGSNVGPVVRDVVDAYFKKQAEQTGMPLAEYKERTSVLMKQYLSQAPRSVRPRPKKVVRVTAEGPPKKEAPPTPSTPPAGEGMAPPKPPPPEETNPVEGLFDEEPDAT